MTCHGAWGVRGDETLVEHLRLLSRGFHEGTDTRKALLAAADEIDALEENNANLISVQIEERETARRAISDGSSENYGMGWNMAIETVLGLLENRCLRKDVTIAELADHVRLFRHGEGPK